MIDKEKYYHTLELDKILQLLAERAGCEDSRAQIQKIRPSESLRDVQEQMDLTDAAYALCVRYGAPTIYNVQSCTSCLRRAQVGASISLRDLLSVSRLLASIRGLRTYRDRCEERGDVKNKQKDSPLDELFFGLTENKPLEDRINAAVVSEEELADDASPALLSIRRKIRGAEASVRELLERMIRSTHYQPFLQETLITQRDGRFVVPVKIEHKNEVKGLIHDTSSSGATVFIEPAGVVEANNKVKLLEGEEIKEMQRIVLELSGECGVWADTIVRSYEKLVTLDIVFTKACFGQETACVIPNLRDDGGIDIRGGRHPLIAREQIVPIDIRLGTDFDTIVITGPNTGGKTVALKTLGLLTLMAMCGMMVPAKEGTTLSVFEYILSDIGDEQSIEQSLSTFSAHMTNIVSILEVANKSSLVLMDELGAGTDPTEGAALAVAIIERLRQYGAKIAATTHYAEIKMYALQTPGVENACCEFDIATLRPTYRLLIGVPGRSNAFAISQRLGLGTDVIEAAKGHIALDNARFEDVVSQLEKTRQQLENERRQQKDLLEEAETTRRAIARHHETLEKEKENELSKARVQAARIVADVKLRSERLMQELDEMRRQKENEDFGKRVGEMKSGYRAAVRKLEDKANPISDQGEDGEYHLPRPLQKGDSVKIVAFGTNGVVITPPDGSGYAMVQTGALKTKVHEKDLRLQDKAPKKRGGKMVSGGGVTKTMESNSTRSVSTEFDMRGMSADEGVMALEQFIDNCRINGVKTLTIIHGKGTGVLRAAVHTSLRRNTAVRTFRLGVFGEGESGVTMVELK